MHFYGAQPQYDLTYSDVFLIPSRSDVGSRLNVSLRSGDGTGMTTPLVASNMNAVTGPRLAASIARRGGLGVLPQDLGADETAEAIAWVKAQDAVWDAPFRASAGATVAEALRLAPPVAGFGVAVVADAASASALDDRLDLSGDVLGVIELQRLARMPHDATLGDLLHEAAPAIDAAAVGGARELFDLLVERELEFAAVVRDGRIVGSISRNGALRSTIYEPALDGGGRLRVAAAVGANARAGARARDLVDAGADVLVVDTAHGHQGATLRALEAVRGQDLGVPIVAGNVVSASGVRDLAAAGAHILKVGVGPGAMCTTRMMTAVGRPQFSAVLECVETADAVGAHVWADGGVRYPRDVALALAAGASGVMIGSWFAGTVEAPGEVRDDGDGRWYKESFGMASTRAVEQRFSRLDAYEYARKLLFAEGISSSRILIDPLRPSLEDLIDMITTGVRSSCTYAGASNLREFRDRARVGIQSAAGYEEGKALPVSW